MSTNRNYTNYTSPGLDIVDIDWSEVSVPFEIVLWVLLSFLLEVGIHQLRKNKYLGYIPETCYLICLGVLLGVLLEYGFDKGSLVEIINEDVFFLILLPPIIFDAGYNMPRLAFLENLASILVFAIFNTLLNAILIGGSIYLVYEWGWIEAIYPEASSNYANVKLPLDITTCLLFGSIISAVDPVAVIAVFNEIHVNSMLFICVFGESLLNDGVAVVLYQAFANLLQHSPEDINSTEIAFLFGEFAYVAFGGILVGIIFSIVTCFATKYWPKNHEMVIFEPAVSYLLPYLAYLTGEYLGMSAILAAVVCGYMMRPHVEVNIEPQSKITLNYVIHFLSHVGEVSIFIWLGLVTVQLDWAQYFNWSLALWALLFISIYRVLGIFTFGYILNYFRDPEVKFTNKDLTVCSFGGLRGGIAFSLTALSPILSVEIKQTLICTSVFIIFFTSFVQGILVEPLVKYLKIELEIDQEENLLSKIGLVSSKQLLKGFQSILGVQSRVTNISKLADFGEIWIWSYLRRDASTHSGQRSKDRYGFLESYRESLMKAVGEDLDRAIVDKGHDNVMAVEVKE